MDLPHSLSLSLFHSHTIFCERIKFISTRPQLDGIGANGFIAGDLCCVNGKCRCCVSVFIHYTFVFHLSGWLYGIFNGSCTTLECKIHGKVQVRVLCCISVVASLDEWARHQSLILIVIHVFLFGTKKRPLLDEYFTDIHLHRNKYIDQGAKVDDVASSNLICIMNTKYVIIAMRICKEHKEMKLAECFFKGFRVTTMSSD